MLPDTEARIVDPTSRQDPSTGEPGELWDPLVRRHSLGDPDERNRARASEVRYVGAVPASRAGASGIPLALATAALFFTLLLGLLVLDEVPVMLLAAYGLLSGVAFLMYGADKSAAVQGRWRTSESTLHTIALVGGWPDTGPNGIV
ncbi:MAG TPA: DUF1294 domain-containing protein [Actinomycetes bacterium]